MTHIQFDTLGTGEPEFDPGEMLAAADCIARHAIDDDDHRQLLEMTGLAPYEHGPFQTYSYGRKTR